MRYTVEVNEQGIFWNKEGTSIRHREDGPAVEYSNGTKEWYLNGKLHRTDGPAVEYSNGTKFWFFNGKRHRKDGPAREFPDGHKEYWLNGVHYSELNYRKALDKLHNTCDNKTVEFDGKNIS